MISGTIKEVVTGLELILDKLHSEVIFLMYLDNLYFMSQLRFANLNIMISILTFRFFVSFMLKMVMMLSLGEE